MYETELAHVDNNFLCDVQGDVMAVWRHQKQCDAMAIGKGIWVSEPISSKRADSDQHTYFSAFVAHF